MRETRTPEIRPFRFHGAKPLVSILADSSEGATPLDPRLFQNGVFSWIHGQIAAELSNAISQLNHRDKSRASGCDLRNVATSHFTETQRPLCKSVEFGLS